MNPVTTGLNSISKIDNSEVIPPSHKWTEVGVLPKDWTVQSLRSCLLSAPSYGINKAAVPFDDDLPTYLRITDISEDGQFRPFPRASVKHTNGQTFFLNEGDLVLARTGASVGKSYLYNTNDGPLVFAGFLIRISPNPEKLQPTFLAYYLQSKHFWNWVAKMSIRSGQPGINGQEYGELRLRLPPIHEQRAIAEVLSDVDGLIGALDALIAKKQAIKQAAMSQLLTGKTRLPGFSGTWETKQIGELICLIPSGIYGLETQMGQLIGMPVATTAHIDLNDRWNEKQMNIRYFTEQQIEHYSPIEGDLIVVKSSGSAASIQSGKVGYVSADKVRSFIFSNFLMLLRATGCNAQFLFFQLTSGRIKQMLPQLVEASTYPNLRINDYLEVQIPLPPEEEQLAIVNVLSDMDAEIVALEKRRDKTRAIKQGMMQQLLTGRVRLLKST